MRWVKHLAGMGQMRNANTILLTKPEGKGTLGRSRCRRKDTIGTIRMDLTDAVWM
jgi:hypothetical protein